jgi:hypothetical protein
MSSNSCGAEAGSEAPGTMVFFGNKAGYCRGVGENRSSAGEGSMGLGNEEAGEEFDAILLAFEEGGEAMERVLDQIERNKIGARFRAGGWKAKELFIRAYDWLCCYCKNPDGAKIFARRFVFTLPGREREIVAHLMALPDGERYMMIDKYFGRGGEK